MGAKRGHLLWGKNMKTVCAEECFDLRRVKLAVLGCNIKLT